MSKELIDAAASYFGMDPERLAQGTMVAGSNGLRFTFTVDVGADDYLGIADRMRSMREPTVPTGCTNNEVPNAVWISNEFLRQDQRRAATDTRIVDGQGQSLIPVKALNQEQIDLAAES